MTFFPSQRMQGIEKTLIRQINDRADASCINLGIGELAFPTPAAILDRLASEVGSWPLGYTANAGLPELRKLIAERAGPGIAAEQVCVTIGAEEALFALIMILVSPGDEVLVPDPGFPSYPILVRMAGGKPISYTLPPSRNFALDVEEVRRVMTPRTRLLILNSPSNPTGAVHSAKALEDLADLCRRQGLTVLADEVYREIIYEGRAASLAQFYERTVVINSLSKTYSMTGWRLGWCIGPPELIRTVIIFNQLAISCPPTICQRAAVLALQGVGDVERAANLEELRRRRDLAVQCLERYAGLKCVRPGGTFYLYFDISSVLPTSRTSWDVALDLIAKEKVVVIPGVAFGRAAENSLRLSFAAAAENIEEGIRRIGRFFGRG